jgi:hypothetical protein
MRAHLSLLRRQGLIADWHDREIEAGEDWRSEISRHLEAADIVLLLVSAYFLESDYCFEIEMKRALERHALSLVPGIGETRKTPCLLALRVRPDDELPQDPV